MFRLALYALAFSTTLATLIPYRQCQTNAADDICIEPIENSEKEQVFQVVHQYAWPSAPVQKETWADYKPLWRREPRYEERFIRSKLKQIDGNLDVFWVPSPVWDLFVVQGAKLREYYSPDSVVPPFYNEFFRWLTTSVPSEVKMAWLRGSDLSTVNYVPLLRPHLNKYTSFLKSLKNLQEDRDIIGALWTTRTEIEALDSCENYPGDVCRSILLAAIEVETEALKTNSVVLFRATNGKTPELLDFPFDIGSRVIRAFSFSYSVLAGFVNDSNPELGACTLAYGSHMRHVYAVLLDRKWLYTRGYKLVHLPTASQYRGAIYKGEFFHPRTRRMSVKQEMEAKVTDLSWAGFETYTMFFPAQFDVAPYEFHEDPTTALSRYLEEFNDNFMQQVRFLKANRKFFGDEGFIDNSRRMIADYHEYHKRVLHELMVLAGSNKVTSN
jgi:hypothetical protein